MPGEKGLTLKQAAFAQAYWELKNATDAYAKVYNVSNMKRPTMARAAHALTDNPKVQARLDEIRAQHYKKSTTTIDDMIEIQREALDIARQKGDEKSIMLAGMNIAKLEGHLVDRAEVRTGQLDPDEAKPDIAALWDRVSAAVRQSEESTIETKH